MSLGTLNRILEHPVSHIVLVAEQHVPSIPPALDLEDLATSSDDSVEILHELDEVVLGNTSRISKLCDLISNIVHVLYVSTSVVVSSTQSLSDS